MASLELLTPPPTSRGGNYPGRPWKLGILALQSNLSSLVALPDQKLVLQTIVVIALEDALVDAGWLLQNASGECMIL